MSSVKRNRWTPQVMLSFVLYVVHSLQAKNKCVTREPMCWNRHTLSKFRWSNLQGPMLSSNPSTALSSLLSWLCHSQKSMLGCFVILLFFKVKLHELKWVFALDILFDKKLFIVTVITLHISSGTQIFMTHRIRKNAFIFCRNYEKFSKHRC